MWQQGIACPRRGAANSTAAARAFAQMLELYFRFKRQPLDILARLFLHLLYTLGYLRTQLRPMGRIPSRLRLYRLDRSIRGDHATPLLARVIAGHRSPIDTVATVNNVRVSGRDQIGFRYLKLLPRHTLTDREYFVRGPRIVPARGEKDDEPLVKVFTERDVVARDLRSASTAREAMRLVASLSNTLVARYVR